MQFHTLSHEATKDSKFQFELCFDYLILLQVFLVKITILTA